MTSSAAGYGARPRCSPMQQEWQTSHPVFKAIKRGQTVKHLLSSSGEISRILVDPHVLLPPSMPSLWSAEPKLLHYTQLALHLWIPDFFLPHLVDFMPCPEPGCSSITTRQRWHSGGPRLLHGVHSAVYLHCWEYTCNAHHGKSFSGWDERSVCKLPPAARATFSYVLTREEGVTTELHSRIVAARVSGSSLNALRRELVSNRYTRMHETIAAYYEHCESYSKQQRGSLLSYLGGGFSGHGARTAFPHLPPVLSNPAGYYDHEPPSVHFMSELCQRASESTSELCRSYTQQLTADRVCIDATFKVAKRISASPSRMLWSMMDISTGCLLHQQMLTHERHDDVLPMFQSYAARCRELGQPLPSRVCSDRGLMDANVINHELAFPDAHINVDIWHFHALFTKTLNKTSEVWKEVSKKFGNALYADSRDADGRAIHTHAEPDAIISAVDDLVAHFSNCGSRATACVTQATKKWWEAQREPIVVRRICSHPASDISSTVRVSSSPLENYHKQLNKLLRIARCNESSMHSFLLQFMLRWNIDRRRAAGLEFDWRIYDLQLLDRSFQACVRVIGRREAAALWHDRGFELPPRLTTQEEFGLVHSHVTLQQRMAAADAQYPYSQQLVNAILKSYVSAHPLPIPPPPVEALLRASAAAPSLSSSSSSTVTAGMPSQLAPARHMSDMALSLFASLMKFDQLMEKAVSEKDWSSVAARWNSFVHQCAHEPVFEPAVRASLRPTYDDVVRHAVVSINRREQLQLEQDIIALQAAKPLIPLKSIPPSSQAFSSYEDETLQTLAGKHNKRWKGGKVVVNWKEVTSVWMRRYISQYEAGKQPRLLPRAADALKSHYFSAVRSALPAGAFSAAEPSVSSSSPVANPATVAAVSHIAATLAVTESALPTTTALSPSLPGTGSAASSPPTSYLL